YDDRKAAETAEDEKAQEAAEKAYQDAMNAVLDTNIELSRLELALNMDPRKPDREKTLAKIKEEHPALASNIQATIDAYEEWRHQRGKGGALDDPSDLQRLLRGAGVLEFRLLAEPDPADPHKFDRYIDNLQKHGPRKLQEDTMGWFPIEDPNYFFKTKDIEKEFARVKVSPYYVVEKYGDKYYVLAHLEDNKTLAQNPQGGSDWQLKAAVPTRDQEGRPAVSFTLDEKGGSKFRKLTQANVGKQLCFFLDGQAVSSARINSAIGTQGIIEGNFSIE